LARAAGFSAEGASWNVTLPGSFLTGAAAPDGAFGLFAAAWTAPKTVVIKKAAVQTAMRAEWCEDMATLWWL
jgi:hypothetical protein